MEKEIAALRHLLNEVEVQRDDERKLETLIVEGLSQKSNNIEHSSAEANGVGSNVISKIIGAGVVQADIADAMSTGVGENNIDNADPVSLLAHYIKAQQEENMRVRELVSKMVDRMVDTADDTAVQSAEQDREREFMSTFNRVGNIRGANLANNETFYSDELPDKVQIQQLEAQVSELTQQVNAVMQDQVMRETSEQIEMMQEDIPDFDADVVAEMMNSFYEMLINQGVEHQEAERITAISWNHPAGWLNLHEISQMFKGSALADIKKETLADNLADSVAVSKEGASSTDMRKPDEHISSTSSGSKGVGIMEMLRTKDPHAQGAALLKLISR